MKKKRLSQMKESSHVKRQDSHKWGQIKANACKQRLDRWVERSKRQQYSERVHQDIFKLVSFFTKRFLHKNANQIKTNQQNKNKRTLSNKGNGFLRTKTSKMKKIVHLSFLKKKLNCPDDLVYYTISCLPLHQKGDFGKGVFL